MLKAGKSVAQSALKSADYLGKVERESLNPGFLKKSLNDVKEFNEFAMEQDPMGNMADIASMSVWTTMIHGNYAIFKKLLGKIQGNVSST